MSDSQPARMRNRALVFKECFKLFATDPRVTLAILAGMVLVARHRPGGHSRQGGR